MRVQGCNYDHDPGENAVCVCVFKYIAESIVMEEKLGLCVYV